MAQSVATINSLLGQFQTANDAVVTGLQTGADVTNAQDTRDNILSQLSQQIGISTVTNPNGSESIYTDSGVTLFQNTARSVTFNATPTLTAGMTGNPVMVDGVPITGPTSPMAIQSGALAGLATLRDTTAPHYQAQLDQIANGLDNAFAETDQSATPTGQPLPGLFTYASFSTTTGLPTDTTVPAGLAGQITVNASVDPSQGGNANLLRDGDVSGGGANYTYNPSGDAGYTTRIQQMITQISTTQSFDPSAGAGSSASLSDLCELFGELAARPIPAGDRPGQLFKYVGDDGLPGAVECDGRQHGRPDVRNAQPREFLPDLGETPNDRERDVLLPVDGRHRGALSMTDYISTQYLSSSLQLSIMKMQTELATAQNESTTGQYPDVGLHLGAQAGQEISLQNENGLLQTYTTTNASVATKLSTTSTALDTLRTNAQNALNNLTQWNQDTDSGAQLQDLGASGLQSFIATTNTSVNGQYVFGGINSGVPPMANYFASPSTAQTAIQSAFSSYLGGLTPPATTQTVTAAQLQTFISSPTFASQFQEPAWSAAGSNWSSASSTNTTSNIGPTDTITSSTNANQPGFSELAQAYTMLNEFTGHGDQRGRHAGRRDPGEQPHQPGNELADDDRGDDRLRPATRDRRQ